MASNAERASANRPRHATRFAVRAVLRCQCPRSTIAVCAISDDKLVRALVRDAHVFLDSDAARNVGRESELDRVKKDVALADKILAGRAADEEKESVVDLVHPHVRSFFLDKP